MIGYIWALEQALERNDSQIPLQILLKEAATKKLRLIVCAHSLGEYLYISSKKRKA